VYVVADVNRTDTPTTDAESIISLLGLEPHPEGGWYAQTYRDAASTAIYFLLPTGQRSHWHRVHGAAEVWHHYAGDPLRLSISTDAVTVGAVTVGPDLAAGHRPQAVVPPGAWQAAEPVAGAHGYVLVGCTVSPPFTFDVFELAPPDWAPAPPP